MEIQHLPLRELNKRMFLVTVPTKVPRMLQRPLIPRTNGVTCLIKKEEHLPVEVLVLVVGVDLVIVMVVIAGGIEEGIVGGMGMGEEVDSEEVGEEEEEGVDLVIVMVAIVEDLGGIEEGTEEVSTHNITHPVNTQYQHTLSIHPINTPYQQISTQAIYERTLSHPPKRTLSNTSSPLLFYFLFHTPSNKPSHFLSSHHSIHLSSHHLIHLSHPLTSLTTLSSPR